MKRIIPVLMVLILLISGWVEARGFSSSRSSASRSSASRSSSYSSPSSSTSTASRSYSTSPSSSSSYSSTTTKPSSTATRSYSTPSQSTRTNAGLWSNTNYYWWGMFGWSAGWGFLNWMLRGSMLWHNYYAPIWYYGWVPYGSYGMMPYFWWGGGYVWASFWWVWLFFYMLLKMCLALWFATLCFIRFGEERIWLGVLFAVLFIVSLLL